MYLSFPFILAVFPFLVAATQSQHTSRASSPLSIPISKRSTVYRRDGTVDVRNLQRALKRTVENIERGLRADERDAGTTHKLARRLKRTSSVKRDSEIGSEVHLTNYNDDIWYGQVEVGTPPKAFNVVFDTGRADFFLPSASCDASCQGHNLYNASESSTSLDTNEKFSMQLNDATFGGEIYTDTVTLAGYTVTNQTIAAATSYPPSLQGTTNFPADGILGMGLPSSSALDSSPVFQTILSQHNVSDQVFGLYISMPGPELIIGGLNTELFAGPFTWLQAEPQGVFWKSHFENLQISQNVILNRTDFIVSTGTTQLIGDTDSVRTVYNNITGSAYVGNGIWTVPCNFTYDISISFNAHERETFNIRQELFKLGMYNKDPNTCVGGIASHDGLKFWILGDVYLINVYTAFDVANNRFGFASLPV